MNAAAETIAAGPEAAHAETIEEATQTIEGLNQALNAIPELPTEAPARRGERSADDSGTGPRSEGDRRGAEAGAGGESPGGQSECGAGGVGGAVRALAGAAGGSGTAGSGGA